MQDKRRPHGSGSIIVRRGIYYGKWRIGERQIMRKLGPVRTPGQRDGLTKATAEAKLRELMADAPAPVAERVTVQDAGARHLAHLEAMGRKPSTLRSYRNQLDAQIVPRIGARPIASAGARGRGALAAQLARDRPVSQDGPQHPRAAQRHLRVRDQARLGNRQPVPARGSPARRGEPGRPLSGPRRGGGRASRRSATVTSAACTGRSSWPPR